MVKKKWSFPVPGNSQEFSILREAGYARLISMVLINRNISSPFQAKKFFSPTINDLEDPWLLPDISKGVDRVIKALKAKEKIVIYGDYDVDGTTGTTLLYKALEELGAHVSYYLPHRLKDGYGLNIAALENFSLSGITLVITVDCGTSNVQEIDFAKKAGIDIIVTDHHEPDEENIPRSLALINPKIKSSKYPFQNLAGVGVVFKFIQALFSFFPEHSWDKYLGLTALGTIADIVPMVGENRVISFLGLNSLNRFPNAGIKALMDISLTTRLDTNGVLFRIAPRINALGRLDYAALAVSLLSSLEMDKAREMALIAENRNTERKFIQDKIMMDALSLLENKTFKTPRSPIILYSDNWHIGVLGIVASKLVEKYYRPVYLIMTNGTDAKGSARGIDGFSIFESLSYCQDILLKFGGHALAGGFSLEVSKIQSFVEKLEDYVEKTLQEDILSPNINVEGEAFFYEIDMQLAERFKDMEPFGNENNVPIFYSRGVKVINAKFMGKDEEHFKLILQQGQSTQEAVGFKMGSSHAHLIKSGSIIDVIYSIDINYWRDEPILRLTIRDLRTANEAYTPLYIKEDNKDRGINIGQVNISSSEMSIIERVGKGEKILLSFSNLQETFKIIDYLISNILQQKSRKLVIVHPLRLEANRYYKFLNLYLSGKDIRVSLLTGSLNGVERERVLESLRADFPCIIITTFDYLCCYKKFFLHQWQKIDFIIFDDNFLDYLSNILIQLDDFSREKGFLFFTLRKRIKADNFIKVTPVEKFSPTIISSFTLSRDTIPDVSGRNIVIYLNDKELDKGIDFFQTSEITNWKSISSDTKLNEQMDIIKKFSSADSGYILCSSMFLYCLSLLKPDNIILSYCPFSWNEYVFLLSFCKNLYMNFSREQIKETLELINKRMPDRINLVKCYNILRTNYNGGFINLMASDNLCKEIGPELLRACLNIFEEIGLYRVLYHRTGYSITMIEHKNKLDLFSSPCYLECLKQREHFDKLKDVFLNPERVKIIYNKL